MVCDPRLDELFVFEEADLEANGRAAVSQEHARGFDRAVWVMGRGAARSRAILVVVFAIAIALVVAGIAATAGGIPPSLERT